jgi:hypothetical protein
MFRDRSAGVVTGVALVVVAAAALLSFRWTYEPDLFWHLAQGREIAAGRLIETNLFSSTHPDFPQPATSWLFDLAAYESWEAAGPVGVQLAQALVLAVTFGLLLAAGATRGSLPAALAVLALGFFVIEPRALPRPHTVSLAGMAACALLVERAQAGRSALGLLLAVPLVALWCNFHVECFFGVVLLGLFAGGELLWPTSLRRGQAIAAAVLVVAAAAATLANPYGAGLLRYLWENASVPSVIRIAELQPPYLPNYAAFFVYLLAGAGVLAVRRRRLALWEPLVFVLFAWLALRHLRFTALFVCATAPMLAAHLAPLGHGRSRVMVAIALAVGLLLSRVPAASFVSQLAAGPDALAPREMIPVGAMEFSRAAGLAGPVFNSNNIGGYVAWARYPEVKVFQDSRLQSYPADHFRSIMTAYRSQPAWDELVSGVDWAVLSRPRPNELSGAGRFPRNAWATVYWDEAAEVLVRRGGRYDSLLSTYEYTSFLPDIDPFRPPPASRRERFLAEATRNARENQRELSTMAALCLAGDEQWCARADRLATERPGAYRAVARLRAIAATQRRGAEPRPAP